MAKTLTQKFLRLLRNKKILAVIIIIAVLIIGSRVMAARKANLNLQTAKVEKGTVSEELVLSGEVKAEEDVKLTFPTGGKIAWVNVTEGQLVQKGQALLSLDKIPLDTAYQQARANLRKYEATVDYVHDQVKNHDKDETYAQRDTRTTAEATKDYYYEAYRAAEYNLNNATLISPFLGLVSYLAYSYPGANVLPTETQIEIVNPQTMYFAVTADQNEVVKLSLKQKVSLVLDSFSDKSAEGEIVFIGLTPQVGESGTVYEVKVSFTPPVEAGKMKIGMTGDAKFILSQKEDILSVPSKFINSDKKGKYLRLGKKNNKVYIEVGLEGEDRVEVKGQIKEGETIYD